MSNVIERAVEIFKRRPAEARKRAGMIVKRPVLNGEEWNAWATRHGIPSPVAADDLHVTIIYSEVEVLMKPEVRPLVITTSRSYFAMFGPDDDVLVLALGGYDTWELNDRNYFFQANGATTKWPTFRPHMTLSYEADGFDLPLDALTDAPDYVILGGEIYDEPRSDDVAKSLQNPEGHVGAAAEIVKTTPALQEAAKSLTQDDVERLSPLDQAAVLDIARGVDVQRGVIDRITGGESPIIKIVGEPSSDVKTARDAQFHIVTEDLAKSLGMKEVFKTNEAEQMVVMIASVAKKDGELVKDLHGDEMDSQALVEFSRDILRGTRAGQFDHNGDNRFEIVQSLFLGEDIQKALGIDLGFEPLLVEMHIPDKNDWAQVMKGEWGASIRGTMYVEEPPE